MINQILFMLSKLPIELSFKLFEPNFQSLIGYVRFGEYLSKWFEANGQLRQIQVVYVPKESNNTFFYRSNVCFLDDDIGNDFSIVKKGDWQPKAANISVISTKWFFTPIIE
jgi:hypothetical protein